MAMAGEELLTIVVGGAKADDSVETRDGKRRVERGLTLSNTEPKMLKTDRIVAVNGQSFGTTTELYALMTTAAMAGSFQLLVARSKDDVEMVGRSVDLVVIEVHRQPDEPLGLGCNMDQRRRVVVSALDGAARNSALHLGDRLVSINGERVLQLADVQRIVGDCPLLTLQVMREHTVHFEQQPEQPAPPPSLASAALPEELESIVHRRDGFEYLLVSVKYAEDDQRPFGLAFGQASTHKVIVSRVQEGSVAADTLRALDRFLLIDGQPVTAEGVAKELVGAAGGNFEAVIERPTTDKRRDGLQRGFEQWRNQRMAELQAAQAHRDMFEDTAPSLPDDVKDIIRRQLERRQSGQLPVPTPILWTTSTGTPTCAPRLEVDETPVEMPSSFRISFEDLHTETEIVSDVPVDKELRKAVT